jgi:hypothetical protein
MDRVARLAALSRAFAQNVFGLDVASCVIHRGSFFMTRDGHLIVEYIEAGPSLSEEERHAVMNRARKLLRAVVYGHHLHRSDPCRSRRSTGWAFAGLPTPLLFGILSVSPRHDSLRGNASRPRSRIPLPSRHREMRTGLLLPPSGVSAWV